MDVFAVIINAKRLPNLIEVSVQEAAGQIRGSFHQFEEAHKVVVVDRRERLDGKLHLGGIAHLISELLHLPGKGGKKKIINK